MAINEQDLSFQNAKWFAGELGDFTAEIQHKLIHADNYGQFQKILLENGRSDSDRLWQGRVDWEEVTGRGEAIQIATPKNEAEKQEDGHESTPHEEHGPHSTHDEDTEIGDNKRENEAEELITTEKPRTNPEQNTLVNQSNPNELAGQEAPNQLYEKPTSFPTQQEPNTFSGAGQPNAFGGTSDPNTLSGVGKPNQLSGTGKPNTFPIRRRRGGVVSGGKTLAKEAGKKVVKRGLVWLLANPWVLIAIGVAIGIIVFIILIIAAILAACKVDPASLATRPSIWPLVVVGHITGICNAPYEVRVPANPPGITTEKKGPFRVGNSDNIFYEITVRHDPSVSGAPPIDNLFLFDVPLFEHERHESTGESTSQTDTEGTRYYQWKLSDNQDYPTDYEFTFSLTLNPIVEDYIAVNAIYVSDSYKPVQLIEGGVDPDSGDYTAWENAPPPIDENDINAGRDAEPSHYTCNREYSNIMTQLSRSYNTKLKNRMRGTGTNFGDPVCSFSQAKLRRVIESFETQQHINQGYVDFWMEIAKCESPGNGPNGWNKTFDSWGQFQMFRSSPNPGKVYDPTSEAKRGDLPWQRQAQEAIRRNNTVIGGSFKYWEAAYCLCGNAAHSDKPYCAQIVADGLDKTCSSCPR